MKRNSALRGLAWFSVLVIVTGLFGLPRPWRRGRW